MLSPPPGGGGRGSGVMDLRAEPNLPGKPFFPLKIGGKDIPLLLEPFDVFA